MTDAADQRSAAELAAYIERRLARQERAVRAGMAVADDQAEAEAWDWVRAARAANSALHTLVAALLAMPDEEQARQLLGIVAEIWATHRPLADDPEGN